MFNKKESIIFVIACCLLGCLFLSSCTKKAVSKSKQYGFVSFTIEWDSLLINHAEKETLRYCFYPSGNGAMIQTESDTGNLKIALPPDTYKLLVYNSNNENIQLKLNKSGDIECLPPFADANSTTKRPLSPLYGFVQHNLVIEAHQDITLKKTPVAFTKRIHFHVLADKSNINDCSMLLTGATSAINGNELVIDKQYKIDIPIIMEKREWGFEGVAHILDGNYKKEQKDELSNTLVFNFSLADGTSSTSVWELGDTLQEASHDSFIEIKATPSVSANSKIALAGNVIKRR